MKGLVNFMYFIKGLINILIFVHIRFKMTDNLHTVNATYISFILNIF